MKLIVNRIKVVHFCYRSLVAWSTKMSLYSMNYRDCIGIELNICFGTIPSLPQIIKENREMTASVEMVPCNSTSTHTV